MSRRPKTLGFYSLGHRGVVVKTREGSGGEFHSQLVSGAAPEIRIGLDSDWPTVVEAALHELMELDLVLSESRYTENTRSHYTGHEDYLFVFSHITFSAACGRVGGALADLLPALSEAYKKHHAAKSRGKKGKK